MPIEIKTLPVPPWKGLYLDGVTVPGGMSRADNVYVLPDGSVERRLYQRTLDENPACLASRGLKSVYELRKADGTRYLFADVDNSDTAIASFGSELIANFASWTPTSGWTYGSSIWTHTTGTTALVATGETAIVATTKYRVVVDITQTPPSAAAAGWTYTSTDSGLVWVNKNGNSHIVWNNKWTHAAGGGTTALTATADFTVIAGETYRIIVHVTHSAGTSLSVYIGGKLAGTITATGLYEYVVPFVTNATALRFVPTNDWAGSIDKYWPHVPNQNDAWVSVQKFIDPAGANIPSNIDTGGTHIPSSHYDKGRELLYKTPVNWYPEEAAQLSQSIAVYLGGTLAGVIQASGEYTYDVTATNTTALTFTPTTSWAGSVNGASVRVSTLGSASTQMKVIGGEVTGTTDYEVSWSNILTNLTTGAAVLPAWATMQDRAFRVDGTNINYYFRDASDYHTLGVPAPMDAPVTASSATTGDLVAGTYNVYYTYIKKDGDYIVEGNPSPVSNTVITGTAIDVNVIGNSDPDITHIRIYRTLYNEEGADAYYEREVLNATKTVTITDADDTIGDGVALEYNHDMPKQAMFVMTGGSRLWLLRFPSEVGGDSMMMWSEVGHPEYFPALNYQTFDPDDGDKIMGAAMMQNNILVFKRHRTWICDVYSMQNIDGVSSISKNILSPTIGCIASGSIQSVGIDQAIWLSTEGIMLYDGGRIRNISKDRINSVINDFIANGAEYYIDSVYHSTKRQYHINFIYRTAAVITSQRHFVYSMDANPDENGVPNGAWTEYVYTSDAGVRYYEINFCLASDSNLMEVILIPYLVTTTGTVAYIYQSDYDIEPTAVVDEFFALGGTDREWHGMGSDSDGNIYAVEWPQYVTAPSGNDIYKRTAGLGDFVTLGQTARCWSGITANSDGIIYACTYEVYIDGEFTGGDIYKQTAGAPTSDDFVSLDQAALDQYWTGLAIDANDNVYACSYGDSIATGGDIYKQTGGTGDFVALGQTHRAWYGITVSAAGNVYACVYGGDIYKQTAGAGAFIALSQTTRNWSGMTADSNGNIFACVYGGLVYKQTAGTGDFVALDSTSKVWRGITVGKNDDIYACNFGNGTGGDIYQLLPGGYWEIVTETISEDDTEPTMRGAIVNIVSNYTDLGIANDKRIKRVYLDTESQYATCGAFTIEPGYNVNIKVHEIGETSEPSGATSLRPFAHPGRQTWDYTNDQFDSTSEAWLSNRIDVGVQGKKFRYSIKVGDVPSANHGTLRIRPPMIDVQVKERY